MSETLESLLARGASAVHTPAAQHAWLTTIRDMQQHARFRSPSHQHDLQQLHSFITQGIVLDLIDEPTPQRYANTHLVSQHRELVRSRLQEYVALGAVMPLPASDTHPDMVQPLHVIVKPGKKPRLVIDLSRNLNTHIDAPALCMETVSVAVQRSKPNCFYTKLDLSNCFLSFPLHPSMFRFFTFEFEGVLYCFVRLPFGLNVAPYLCTLLLSVVSFRLTQLGITHTRYLDDWLLIALTHAACTAAGSTTKQVFALFGLVNNNEKEVPPTQVVEYLGIIIDSRQQQIRLSAERVTELLGLLHTFSQHNRQRVTIARARTLLGKLSFAATVLPTARPFMRALINMTLHKSPHAAARFTNETYAALQFWQHRLPLWNGLLKWPSITSVRTLHIYTDASIAGFGFHCAFQVGRDTLESVYAYHGVFDQRFNTLGFLDHRRIALLELIAVLMALHQLATLFDTESPNSFRAIRLHTDNNTNVGAIMAQATKSSFVGPVLRAIYDFCFRRSLTISAVHIEGTANCLADFLSRPSLNLGRPELHWSAFAQKLTPPSPLLPSAFLCMDSLCLSLPELFDRRPPGPSTPLSTWSPASPSA